MCGVFLEDDLFLPLEGMGVLVVGGNEVVDRLAQLLGTGKTGGGEGLAAEEAEPDLHLIEPGGVGGDVMEVHVAMSLPPAVMFGRNG